MSRHMAEGNRRVGTCPTCLVFWCPGDDCTLHCRCPGDCGVGYMLEEQCVTLLNGLDVSKVLSVN